MNRRIAEMLTVAGAWMLRTADKLWTAPMPWCDRCESYHAAPCKWQRVR